MDEFSVNRLSIMLDCDRQTLARALKKTPADAGTDKKPLFRVSTAVEALEAHRGRPDRRRKTSDGGGHVDVELQRMFIKLDDLHGEIAGAATIEARRKLMREEFFPLNFATTRAMTEASRRCGEDREFGSLRIAEHERVQLMTLRQVCGWNADEVMDEYNAATELVDDTA